MVPPKGVVAVVGGALDGVLGTAHAGQGDDRVRTVVRASRDVNVGRIPTDRRVADVAQGGRDPRPLLDESGHVADRAGHLLIVG